MAERQSRDGRNADTVAANFAVSAHQQFLFPRATPAIRGIGESSLPIRSPVRAPCRCRSQPALSARASVLSPHDSGADNGPFGFGWPLSIPAIKTDKSLPQYCGADESHVCIPSGAEHLVPVLDPDAPAVGGAAAPSARALRECALRRRPGVGF
jgi:hypothetical protein